MSTGHVPAHIFEKVQGPLETVTIASAEIAAKHKTPFRDGCTVRYDRGGRPSWKAALVDVTSPLHSLTGVWRTNGANCC